jgi:hypothetical protein
LRHRYTGSTTKEYYEECVSRLNYLRDLIDSIEPEALGDLRGMMAELNRLSTLITYIERSHLEEFSWPFAYALERVSRGVCTDIRTEELQDTVRKPLFFFRAEGGRTSYAVVPERRTSGIFWHKIFSVVFPRTLKDSVLLHAIIGHEIGHAVQYSHPSIATQFAVTLLRGSQISDKAALFEWCRANLGVQDIGSPTYLDEMLRSWAFEFFSDFLGLIMMGPSFLAAFQSLLELNSQGPAPAFVPRHPPHGTRALTLMTVARALNLLYSEQDEPTELGKMSHVLDDAFAKSASNWANGPYSILDPERIHDAAALLQQFLSKYEGLIFPTPDHPQLAELVEAITDDVPPAGPYPAVSEANGHAATISPPIIDFRHILLAGWLRWSQVPKKDGVYFRHINMLCSHAIMQQEGLLYWRSNSNTPGGTA